MSTDELDLPTGLEDYLTDERLKKASGTMENREADMKKFGRWLASNDLAVDEVTEHELKQFLYKLNEDGYAGSTISVKLNSLSRLYKYLVDRGVVESNPVDEIDRGDYAFLKGGTQKSQELKEDVYYIDAEEKERLCDNVNSPKLRNELLIRLLWQTGLRRSEVVDIRLSDLDWDEQSIQIRSAKTNSNRIVFWQDNLNLLLKQWVQTYREQLKPSVDSPYLFITSRSDQMPDKHVNKVVREAADNAGLNEILYEDPKGREWAKVTAHTLRHSFAVQCLKNGMDIMTLSKLMGHEQLETTRKYLRLAKDDLRQQSRQFGAGTEDIGQSSSP